eukprot:14736381-Ditylum_brightwellii.AAC.1
MDTIFSTISAAVLFLTKTNPAPVVRAYHAAVPSTYSRSDLQAWCSYQSILVELQHHNADIDAIEQRSSK